MVAQGLYIIYYGLHLVALVTLPILTITLIWPKRSTPNRHPILPVNTGFWACYALSSLLLYALHIPLLFYFLSGCP